jgi:hypothetical protein
MTMQDMTEGLRVYDRWWPYRVGTVTKVTKSSVWVGWRTTPRPQRYDKHHVQFLEPMER